jgi:tetratricopeptide (TPR) repeat protein
MVGMSKNPSKGVGSNAQKNYFFTQAGLVSFSFFEQSTFLSSILPPPWLPAKEGADISMKAQTRAVITIFIETPSGNEVEKNARMVCRSKSTHCHPNKHQRHTLKMDKSRPRVNALTQTVRHLTGMGLVILLPLLPVAAQERYRPAAADVVLPISVHASGGRGGALRSLEQVWRAQPQDLNASLAYARAVFTLGLSEGDLRWFGSAKAALAPWWTRADLPAEGHFLRGLVQQGFHAFDAGLLDINRAIALEPRRAEFWSWRFALHLLLADMAAARQDIEEMARLLGPEEAGVYRAVLLYRTGQPQPAVDVLKQAIRSASFQDASSQDWLGFHLGEAHRVAGQSEQAIAVWGQRLKASPQSHLIRLSLAELLNQLGLHAQAKSTAFHKADTSSLTDALLVQALLASRGLKDPDEARLASQMDARLQSQALRQEALIERPKLIYQIAYGRDLAAGLALSIDNWQLQKEPPDALLFVQAALALGQARAAEPVLVWVQKTGYNDPQLKPLLQRLQSHPSWTRGRP